MVREAGPSPESPTDQQLTRQEREGIIRGTIDVPSLEDEKIEQFARWRLQVYEKSSWEGSILSEAFGTDFHKFSEDDIDRIPGDVKRDLRILLRKKGVYVRTGRGISYRVAFTEAIKDELEWPENDTEHPQSTPDNNATPPNPLIASTSSPIGTQPGTLPTIQNSSPSVQKPPPALLSTPATQLPATLQAYPTTTSQSPPLQRIPHSLPRPYDLIENYAKLSLSNGKEFTSLTKLYTNKDEKYSGGPTESFDFKFNLFLDLARRAEIPATALTRAFPIMLTDGALEYYYTSCQGLNNATIYDLYNRVSAHFEGDEHRRNMLREWNAINLRSMIRKAPEKKRSVIFHEMVQLLSKTQRGLHAELQTDSALYHKIIQSCSDIPACSTVTLLQTQGIPGLVNNIHATLEMDDANTRAEKSEPLNASNFITDRRYYTTAAPNTRHSETAPATIEATKHHDPENAALCARKKVVGPTNIPRRNAKNLVQDFSDLTA